MDKKHDFIDTLLEKEKEILNEISDKNIIYEETQTGPQEEPFLFEYSLDLNMWSKYLKEKDKKRGCLKT